MTVRSYKDLNLVRANIETECRQFIQTRTYVIQLIGPMPGQNPDQSDIRENRRELRLPLTFSVTAMARLQFSILRGLISLGKEL
jgi:hypothetical protein